MYKISYGSSKTFEAFVRQKAWSMSISIRINTIITWYQFFIILIPTIKIKVNTKIFKRRKIGRKINSKKKIVCATVCNSGLFHSFEVYYCIKYTKFKSLQNVSTWPYVDPQQKRSGSALNVQDDKFLFTVFFFGFLCN